MLVTAIEPRRKGLSALYLDGQETLVDTETLLSYRIKLGDEMDEVQLEALCRASDCHRARERALYILGYRDHSREELKRKLRQASFSEEAAENAVQKTVEMGLVNDREYARKLARELLLRKKLSERRAMGEMLHRGLERELAAEAIADVAPDPIEQLVTIIEKKYIPLPRDEKGQRRMHNALARMGYGFSEIRAALSQIEEFTESWNEPDE